MLLSAKSGRQDLNLRPLGPQPSALPDCATPRGCLTFLRIACGGSSTVEPQPSKLMTRVRFSSAALSSALRLNGKPPRPLGAEVGRQGELDRIGDEGRKLARSPLVDSLGDERGYA